MEGDKDGGREREKGRKKERVRGRRMEREGGGGENEGKKEEGGGNREVGRKKNDHLFLSLLTYFPPGRKGRGLL